MIITALFVAYGFFYPVSERFIEVTQNPSIQMKSNSVSLASEMSLDLRSIAAVGNVSLAFNVATFQRINHCKIRLRLDALTSSHWIPCSSMEDNSLVTFRFDEPITPALYTLSIEKMDVDASNNVAFYVKRNADNHEVPPVFLAQRNTLFSLLSSWWHKDPMTSLLYCVLAAEVFMLLGEFRFSRFYFPILVFFLGATIVICKPFSGFDETAHILMLQQALTKPPTEPIPHEPLEPAFYAAVKDSMRSHDFEKMHGIDLPTTTPCPHKMLIGDCGITSPPMGYYRSWATIVNFLSKQRLWRPLELIWMGRGMNIILLALLLLMTSHFGFSYRQAMAFVLLTSGCLLAQLPSITNDFPFFVLGIWSGLLAVKILLDGFSRWRWLDIALVLSFAFWCRNFDRSIIIFCMNFAMLIICALMAIKRTDLRDLSLPRTQFFSLIVGGLCAYVVFNIIGVKRWLALFPSLESIANKKINDLSLILVTANMKEFSRSLWSFFKSWSGTYVWGHTDYPLSYYLVFCATMIGLACFGLMRFSAHTTRKAGSVFLFAVGFILVAYLFVVVAVGHIGANFTQAISRESYTKIRLTASGIGLVWFLPMLGLCQVEKSSYMSLTLDIVITFILIYHLFYFFPLVYLAPVF